MNDNVLSARPELRAMAAGIYEAALDMDFADYIDTREEDINRLSAALESLNPADENEGILLQALERIYT